MLPFLQDKDGVMAQGPDEKKEYSGMDAIAEDILSAVKSGNPSLLVAALESFREQLRSEDIEQDNN